MRHADKGDEAEIPRYFCWKCSAANLCPPQSAKRTISLTVDELECLADFHENNGHMSQAEYFRSQATMEKGAEP